MFWSSINARLQFNLVNNLVRSYSNSCKEQKIITKPINTYSLLPGKKRDGLPRSSNNFERGRTFNSGFMIKDILC